MLAEHTEGAQKLMDHNFLNLVENEGILKLPGKAN